MIDYGPFWETVKERGLSWSKLVSEYGINPNTLHRLKNNKTITTDTINLFCGILSCDVSGVLRYTKEN